MERPAEPDRVERLQGHHGGEPGEHDGLRRVGERVQGIGVERTQIA